MKNSTNNTESKTDSTPNDQVETTTTDDFGYDIPADDKKTSDEPPAPAAVEEPKEEKVEKLSTGYGDDDEEVVPPVEDKKEEPKEGEELTDEQKAQKEIDEAVKALGDEFDKDKVKKFATEHKLSKAQVEAWVKQVNEDNKEAKRLQEEAVKAQRKTWKEELKKDPEFGGENFDKNVDRVEKVLKNNMPNTKKMLTERGSMLPPYIMKDLLSLSKALNPVTKFVGGEPSEPKKEEGNFLDDLYS